MSDKLQHKLACLESPFLTGYGDKDLALVKQANAGRVLKETFGEGLQKLRKFFGPAGKKLKDVVVEPTAERSLRASNPNLKGPELIAKLDVEGKGSGLFDRATDVAVNSPAGRSVTGSGEQVKRFEYVKNPETGNLRRVAVIDETSNASKPKSLDGSDLQRTKANVGAEGTEESARATKFNADSRAYNELNPTVGPVKETYAPRSVVHPTNKLIAEHGLDLPKQGLITNNINKVRNFGSAIWDRLRPLGAGHAYRVNNAFKGPLLSRQNLLGKGGVLKSLRLNNAGQGSIFQSIAPSDPLSLKGALNLPVSTLQTLQRLPGIRHLLGVPGAATGGLGMMAMNPIFDIGGNLINANTAKNQLATGAEQQQVGNDQTQAAKTLEDVSGTLLNRTKQLDANEASVAAQQAGLKELAPALFGATPEYTPGGDMMSTAGKTSLGAGLGMGGAYLLHRYRIKQYAKEHGISEEEAEEELGSNPNYMIGGLAGLTGGAIASKDELGGLWDYLANDDASRYVK